MVYLYPIISVRERLSRFREKFEENFKKRGFSNFDEAANARHVPTRPRPNYKNLFTHAR
jgi:hypothetical protein